MQHDLPHPPLTFGVDMRALRRARRTTLAESAVAIWVIAPPVY